MTSDNKVTLPVKQPQWLPSFPFVESQWSVIKDICDDFPSLECYDITLDWQQFIEQNNHLDPFSQLRQFRQSRLAYLAFQDFFAPIKKHTNTMLLVSKLADFLLGQAWEVVNEQMTQRYGLVHTSKGEVASLQVFALGKLGTNELNYSSDIDLVFVHDGAGFSTGEKSLDATSWFMRFGKKLIQLLDSFTHMGRVYQVDMRLRPFGSAGPLVCSKNALIQYLVNEGRDWERFAWMRARLVCGNQETASELLREVNAFIYRRHLDYRVFDALAKIKSDIALEHQTHEQDLKHGPGGIRTIEFIIQSLQVVFGGRIQQLQGVSIHPQFSLLLTHKKLSAEYATTLEHAWLWLRKLENMAQIVHDQATHELPKNPELQSIFAQILGVDDWQQLSAQLKDRSRKVDQIFSEIFNQPNQSEHQLDAEQKTLLQQLIETLNLSRVPQDTSQKAQQLLELTVGHVDAAICHDFASIVKVLLKRPNYLLMLLKERNVYQNVLALLAKDVFFKDILTRYPVLFEQLFEYQPLKALTEEQLNQDWQQLVSHKIDTEQWMEQIRYFKLLNVFNLMRFYSSQLIDESQLSKQLTLLAEFILQQVIHFSYSELRQKFNDINIQTNDLLVIAYGSMAVWSMKASSDMDLVFIINQPQISSDERVFLHRWIKRIMHHLNSQMYHGLLYEIDLQLRPNGNSGPLVTTRNEFEHYQLKEAWIWEHAAMVKSRLVYGTQEQKSWHQKFRKEVLSQVRDADQVDADLNQMAMKLAQVKKSKAHESDFSLLASVLKYAHLYPEITACQDMTALKNQLMALKLIKKPD